MQYMIMLVLAQADQLEGVVEVWQAEGIEDVTVFQSKSLIQVQDRCRRDDLPLFPSMRDIFENEEFDHYTLFTVVDGEDLIDRLIASTEERIGDLDNPGNGALVALPVARAKGLRQGRQS
jgi:hypothetical protein